MPRLETYKPSTPEPDAYHPRPDPSVSEAFVRNVQRVGIVQPPVCRTVNGLPRVLDGMRRLEAARRAGLTEAPVLVLDDDSDERALAVILTTATTGFQKDVTAEDEEAALRELVGGPRRPFAGYESRAAYHEARYELGLDSEVDVLRRAIGDVKGVGDAVLSRLINEFGDTDSVRNAAKQDLEDVDGIGRVVAGRIRRSFHQHDDDWRVTSHV